MDRVARRGRHGRGAARPARQRAERPARHHSRELMSRLALQLHLVKEGITDVLRGGAPSRSRCMVEPALETAAGDSRATRCLVPAAVRHVSGLGRQPAHAGVRDRATAASAACRCCWSAASARIASWRASAGCMSSSCRRRRGRNPRDGARATRGRAARRRAGRQAAQRADRGLRQRPAPSAVVRRYRGEPSPLVRSGDGSWRTGRLDAVLRGDFDLIGATLSLRSSS